MECLGSESRRLLQVQVGVSASGAWGQMPAEPSRQVRTLVEQVRGGAGYGLNADLAITGRTSRSGEECANAHTGSLGLASLLAPTTRHSRLGDQLSS